jgi:hypothetical protein
LDQIAKCSFIDLTVLERGDDRCVGACKHG